MNDMQRLAEPFDPSEIEWKPGKVSGERCLALAYIDARCVMDRLDEVLGTLGWQDAYDVLTNGSVTCRLSVRIGEEWVTKMDVGAQSEQPDEGDRMKAAFSDALKRTAVKFGIGRYLYSLAPQWVDFDPVKKRITKAPTLPAFACPQAKPAPVNPDLRKEYLPLLEAEAKRGMACLEFSWKNIPAEARAACQSEIARLKQEAVKHATVSA